MVPYGDGAPTSSLEKASASHPHSEQFLPHLQFKSALCQVEVIPPRPVTLCFPGMWEIWAPGRISLAETLHFSGVFIVLFHLVLFFSKAVSLVEQPELWLF